MVKLHLVEVEDDGQIIFRLVQAELQRLDVGVVLAVILERLEVLEQDVQAVVTAERTDANAVHLGVGQIEVIDDDGRCTHVFLDVDRQPTHGDGIAIGIGEVLANAEGEGNLLGLLDFPHQFAELVIGFHQSTVLRHESYLSSD